MSDCGECIYDAVQNPSESEIFISGFVSALESGGQSLQNELFLPIVAVAHSPKWRGQSKFSSLTGVRIPQSAPNQIPLTLIFKQNDKIPFPREKKKKKRKDFFLLYKKIMM